jgi:serine/threonine-protein kinase
VSKNSSVNLVVSAGPAVTVPSVVGQTFAQATQLISGAGLGYTTTYESSNKAVGTVLAQDPAGNQQVKSGTRVHLTVSGTQTSTPVPSVLGLSPSAAGAKLQANNLSVGTQTSGCPSPYPAGQVAAQSPAPPSSQLPNTPVNLVVSNCLSVPGVVGQSSGAAQATLSNAQLSPNLTADASCAGGASPGQVESQSPTPGALVAPGTTITLTVCQPPVTTTTNSTTTTTTTPTSTTTTTPGGHGQGQGG